MAHYAHNGLGHPRTAPSGSAGGGAKREYTSAGLHQVSVPGGLHQVPMPGLAAPPAYSSPLATALADYDGAGTTQLMTVNVGGRALTGSKSDVEEAALQVSGRPVASCRR